jgi:hypothetical protein
MTVEERLWTLVTKLRDRTRDGSTSWEVSPTKNTFQTATPKFVVSITEIPNAIGEPDYAFRVYDESGRIIEQTTDADLLRAGVATPPFNPFRTMQDLYTLARRNAMRVESALDEILSSLDEN